MMKQQESIKTSGLLCCAQVMGSFGGGGAQRLAYNLAKGLSRQGARSFAIALRKEGDYVKPAEDGIRVAALRADVRRPATLVKAFLSLRKLIRRENIELLHVHGAPTLPFVILATRGLNPMPSIVFTWHDSESVLESDGWRRRLMAWALRRCDAISGSSRLVAKKLEQRAGLENVGVFYGGVPALPDPPARHSARPLVVWIGRIVPPKDPQLLVRSAGRLRDSGAAFSIAVLGKPTASTEWYMAETRDLIKKLDLEDVVSTPGFAGDDELARIMKRAEISVQTSHTEGLSLALLECMMSGQAVIATDVGDTAAAVEDGVSGILIAPGDERQLSDALHRLLGDPLMRQRMAAAARKRAIEQFSIEAMSKRAWGQYASLLKAKHLKSRS